MFIIPHITAIAFFFHICKFLNSGLTKFVTGKKDKGSPEITSARNDDHEDHLV